MNGIVIKNVEKPISCFDCIMSYFNFNYCYLAHDNIKDNFFNKTININCPIEETIILED